jgi:predicted metal-binding protein
VAEREQELENGRQIENHVEKTYAMAFGGCEECNAVFICNMTRALQIQESLSIVVETTCPLMDLGVYREKHTIAYKRIV